MATKSEFQRHLEERLTEIQDQINTFNKKVEESGEVARKELERSLDDLKARNEKAERQLNDLRSAGEDVWQTMATDIESHWKDFTAAVNNVIVESEKDAQRTGTQDVSSADPIHGDLNESDIGKNGS